MAKKTQYNQEKKHNEEEITSTVRRNDRTKYTETHID